MKSFYAILLTAALTIIFTDVNAQNVSQYPSCSHEDILARQLEQDPNALLEIQKNEEFTKAFLKASNSEINKTQTTYTIPVVLHVFHDGDDGKIDMEQALSGIDVINNDYNGLNDGWDSIDPLFDGIKGTLDIELCLASIDPEGNPTTGVLYYDDPLAMLNEVDLFQHAWDNYKYLNIYIPKYTNGEPSLFTAYAYYPNTNAANNNTGGIFYSSIRWGYGNNSELESGQDWASVGTHEMGHWLNLRHTFDAGCGGSGDLVADTPPTLGGTIELEGCYNNDFSCGVATNGENFMDYNHDCKKMFTQGQVDRMIAALNLPSRITLWSQSNLEATGCAPFTNTSEIGKDDYITVYPNPSSDYLIFKFEKIPNQISIFDAQGKLVFENAMSNRTFNLNTSAYSKGIYFYFARFDNRISNGKFIVE